MLADPYTNKGTAFTDQERDQLGLHGLLPPVVESLETQVDRIAVEYDAKTDDVERHVFLRALQERNSVLFYAFVQDNLDQVLPVLYTPTVGLACQQWSSIYRREHGLFLSWPMRDRVAELIDNVVGDREIDVIVATDGERILGLGDLGAGGMGIPIGKLALYTAGGGLDPARTLPVFLDVGTDNESMLSDPLYLGWRHKRLRDDSYDELVDAFVEALVAKFPKVVLQWEDFAQQNANRLLARHRDQICSFNDDIQGTAAVATAAIVAGMRVAESELEDLRLVVVGAGSAGTGIAEQVTRALMSVGLSEADARSRCWLVDRDGLLRDDMDGLLSFQTPFAHRVEDLVDWTTDDEGHVSLLEVVRRVKPHALVGVTGQPGLFTEDVIRAMAQGVRRPIVLPLSNPTPRVEAVPADVLAWTDGRALVGTGSPFDDVEINGVGHQITQVNNLYVFPGLGLGIVAVGAQRVTDSMLTAAATAIGDLASPSGGLLPPIDGCRDIARHVAFVVAKAAIAAGVADSLDDDALSRCIEDSVWRPEYRPSFSD